MERYWARLVSFYRLEEVAEGIFYYEERYPNRSVSIEDLALAGFVYEGDGDTVRCPECRVRFSDWVVGDDPYRLHRTTMPHCLFVRRATESTNG